jgi:hypothetical protein
MSFETIKKDSLQPMTAAQKKEQKNRLLKAKIAVALHDELGRVPKQEEIEQVFLMTKVMYKAVLGLHFKRKEQKKNGQLAIF